MWPAQGAAGAWLGPTHLCDKGLDGIDHGLWRVALDEVSAGWDE